MHKDYGNNVKNLYRSISMAKKRTAILSESPFLYGKDGAF